jgi:hypothetical protein
MAIGDSGKPVKNTIPGQGPQGAADRVGKHVRGSGPMPGTGASAGETAQANKRGSAGDADNDGM